MKIKIINEEVNDRDNLTDEEFKELHELTEEDDDNTCDTFYSLKEFERWVDGAGELW